jgi:hypothetical protein
MTYLDAVLYTGGVIWCGFMGATLLAALINAAKGNSEVAQSSATVFWIAIAVTLLTCFMAFGVWMDSSQ